MRAITLGLLAASTLLAGCETYGNTGADPRYASYSQYDYNNPDPQYGGYYADKYYREDRRRYQERRLGENDRVYRGQDGRYYCRRPDGTTGLVVGGIVGGVLGNLIAPGGSKVLGTLLGGAGGAIAGNAIDKNEQRNDARCR
ncbi:MULTISPECIES: glycine zipper 2TM domain-containing protein [unclassified Sphingomonas]|uniref:glycine zipper 2TM domain-containing protein n=1 Tax=unclassified Sphingomonas TaxID=196159 RepID=UPI00267DC5B5